VNDYERVMLEMQAEKFSKIAADLRRIAKEIEDKIPKIERDPAGTAAAVQASLIWGFANTNLDQLTTNAGRIYSARTMPEEVA
jgi:hypothetical protein